jgi:predicted outer membrane protein
MANAEEIGDGSLADSMATNANVKAFARDMVKDHRAMQGDVDKLTGLTPTPPPNADAERQRAERRERLHREQREARADGGAHDEACDEGREGSTQ